MRDALESQPGGRAAEGLGAWKMLGLVLGLLVGFAGLAVVVSSLWLSFARPPSGGMPAGEAAAPGFEGPLLESEEGQVLAVVREEEAQRLGALGWVEHGRVARIPIEEAMKILAQGGRPVSSSSVSTSSPPASLDARPHALRSRMRERPAGVEAQGEADLGLSRGVSPPKPEISPKLGAAAAIQSGFVDEAGRAVTLSRYLGSRPVLLALVYYGCPMLCSMLLNGVSSALKALSFSAGREFEVVVVSIDPREGPDLAAAKKKAIMSAYGRSGTDGGVHFLTGTEPNIEALAGSVGFGYVRDERSGEYAHAAGLSILTPDGRVSRYLYGIEPAPRDLRFALIEAAAGKIGTAVDRLWLLCYRWDPTEGRYGVAILGAIRAAGIVTVLGLFGFISRSVARDRRSRRGGAP